ncbi:MAG: alpha-2,8-polysialyltransferase family protein [Thiomicrorhabdus sp.]|nr:alpha-2,8-polysialyltransferase family protein [Thiomicrorhabdus sp.]
MTVMSAQKRKVLYLPSTPLNLLVSVAHAVAHSSEQIAQIVLIDQKSGDENVYFKALKSWNASPFEKVELTLGVAQGGGKIIERKKNFKKLSTLFHQFQPNVIAVGSDRRVEFQYLMHLGSLSSPNVEGWYMDDGLYSYAGRKSNWLKDTVNATLKKMVYGRWWQEPRLVGSSPWIKQAWLFQPDRSISALNQKIKRTLQTKWFASSEVQALSCAIFDEIGMNTLALERLQKADVILLIPHPNNIKKMCGYIERLTCFMEKLQAKDKRVVIKYHPRTEGVDPLFLQKNKRFWVMPSSLAFEFVLPMLKSNAIVVGDVGTTLLTTQWLRPDIQSIAVLPEQNNFERNFKALFLSFGVTVVSDFDSIIDGRWDD